MNCGNSKTCGVRRQYHRCGIGSRSDRNEEGSWRGFNFRPEIEKAISGDQETSRQQEGLAAYPVGQEAVQQPREVLFPLLRSFNVFLRQRHQDGFLALWLAPRALPLPAVLCLSHLKKYIGLFLTGQEDIYRFSSSQDTNMDNRRLSKEKQVFVLAALCEGTPIRAIVRMLKTEKYVITRVIRETGAAFADYMNREFRDLSCCRIEMDEQWQYVGCHSGRMPKPKTVYEKRDNTRGDFWLWGVH